MKLVSLPFVTITLLYKKLSDGVCVGGGGGGEGGGGRDV